VFKFRNGFRKLEVYSMQKLLPSDLLSTYVRIRIYTTITLPMVLYGCDTWSLTLRREYRLRMLWRIFRPKRDEVAGGWRKLHNEEPHNLYSSQIIIRIIEKDEVG
jgi:hypothetical protein